MFTNDHDYKVIEECFLAIFFILNQNAYSQPITHTRSLTSTRLSNKMILFNFDSVHIAEGHGTMLVLMAQSPCIQSIRRQSHNSGFSLALTSVPILCIILPLLAHILALALVWTHRLQHYL